MATESHPAGDDNDQNNEQFDGAKEVLQPQAPFQRERVDEESGSNAGQTNATLIPTVDLHLRSVEDVLAEDDAVTRSPAEEHSVRGEHGRGEELGLGVNIFQVVLFTAIPERCER